MKEQVHVSHEMITLVGQGVCPDTRLPEGWIAYLFRCGGEGKSDLLHYREALAEGEIEDSVLVFFVAASACERLFEARPQKAATWHLPSRLLALANSIIHCEATGEAATTLRLARSIELLCQIHVAFEDGATLVPVERDSGFSELDVARIAMARRSLDQSWHEKLTIAQLARIAGINRDKLVRGFHEIYGTTIAQALTERRLAEARQMLLSSQLPVSTIAYRCSYLNNASFTRAFNRRYGIAPSELRRQGIAA